MAKIIWGFPGVGKSFASDGKKVIDADCRLFMWKGVTKDELHGNKGGYERNPEYPENYVSYVNSVEADFVLINCDTKLLSRFQDVLLVYPDVSLKEEYLRRYQARGDNQSFLAYMEEEFEWAITSFDTWPYRKEKLTKENQYLSDVLEQYREKMGERKNMFMTKKEIVELLNQGKELLNSESYQKTNCDILAGYQLNEIGDFEKLAQELFDGTHELYNRNVFDELKTDMERAKFMIARELALLEKRGGLTHQELADKIMQGIVNGALGIRYAEIAPYSHGYEVTFGGDGPAGSTYNFTNRWECYCDFFGIGQTIAGKIENERQDGPVFGKKCEELHIEEMLEAIDKREEERIQSFTPEQDTDFERAKNSYTYPYRSSVATVMDVHAGKGLDGIALHHYHGDWSSITPVKQNSMVEMLVCLNGFCLDQLHQLDVPEEEHKEKIVEYLKAHGTDVSTPEKLEAWVKANPEKCALPENRDRKVGLNEKITEAKGRAAHGAPSGTPVKSLETDIKR